MEQSWQQNNEYECMKYSVLMPVYHKENPAYFYQAAASMMNQTIPPDEFVLVCDGPLTPVLDETIQTIDRNGREFCRCFAFLYAAESHGRWQQV